MMEAANNQKRPKDAQHGASANATSPYESGGGGVTFERKVAVSYLLITAARAYEREPSLILAMGVRRAPNLVNSDESTQKLIRDFVRGVVNAPVTGQEHRFALVVAGPQEQAKQLAMLADLGAVQMNAPAFFGLVRTPGKFAADVRGRLDQLEALVRRAIGDIETTDPDTTLVQQRTWELLLRLTVLMPRLESPDETDWATVVNSLIPIARGGDLTGASEQTPADPR